MSIPRESFEEEIKHICQCLQGDKVNRLTFHPNTSLEIDLYVDADFPVLWNYEDNQDPVYVKFRTGYVLTLVGYTIIWSSKLQLKFHSAQPKQSIFA